MDDFLTEVVTIRFRHRSSDRAAKGATSSLYPNRLGGCYIFDTERVGVARRRHRYQLVYVGWRDSKRVYGVVLHVDIIDGKIWVQQDGTEVGIANKLVELGVSKEDIVLGIDPPKMRQYTDFAVG